MSDFFDEPQVNIFPTEKNVVVRHANYRQPPFPQNPKLRPIPIKTSHIGHGYSEPLRYHNPLDVDHNAADVGFYQGPKHGGVHHNKKPKGFIPPPPPPRSFQPAHRPRLLDEVNHDVDFLDVPKVGTEGEFFGEALRQNSFEENFSFDESLTTPLNPGFEAGKVPNNFPRPNIGSQLDQVPNSFPRPDVSSQFAQGPNNFPRQNIGSQLRQVPNNFPRPDISSQLNEGPEQRAPSFTGFADAIFDEPDFDVRQNFRDLRPEFRDVDDGTFNKIEPFPQSEQIDGGRPNFPGNFFTIFSFFFIWKSFFINISDKSK